MDSTDPIRILCGSGRSGTTWVLDCLARANALRPIFEPLQPAVTPLGDEYAYRSLDPADAHAGLEAHLLALHSGRYRSLWTDYRARRDLLFGNLAALGSVGGLKRRVKRWRKYFADRAALAPELEHSGTLIKLIRANLMIEWLQRRLGARVALIVRHPGAVVESQLRLGEMWDPSSVIERYRRDARLLEHLNPACRALLGERLSRAAALTLCWCIENVGPVSQAPALGYEVVFYETLRRRGATEWARLAASLGLSGVPGKDSIERPSQQTAGRRSSRLQDGSPYWLERLDSSTVDDVADVLEKAGCAFYRLDTIEPVGAAKDRTDARGF